MTEESKHNCIEKDDLLEQTKLNIEKIGLQVIMVSSANYSPSFSYSIGLTKTYNHPEIICFGLSNQLGHEIINDVAEIIKKGENIDVGKIYSEIFSNSRATRYPKVAPSGTCFASFTRSTECLRIALISVVQSISTLHICV